MHAANVLAGCIQVWRLDLAHGEVAKAERVLTESELGRAARIGSRDARAAFVLTRAALRQRLAEYLGVDPLSIRFDVNHHGKPRLIGTEENQGLVFSVSHSGRVALLAFARDLALGVDTERLRTRRGLDDLARHCLSDAELESWFIIPEAGRLEAFIRYWVCKEAFVKATGRGIALGLKRVEVRDDFTGFSRVPEGLGPADNWRLAEWRNGGQRQALVHSGSKQNLQVMI